MATHLDEEEQVENLKRWLRENGLALVLAVVAGVGGYFGWSAWQGALSAKRLQASADFDALGEAIAAKDSTRSQALADGLIAEFADTPYAAAAEMLRAAEAANRADYAVATQHLQWVIEHADDAALRDLARLRMARIHWQQDQLDQALAALPTSDTYAALVQSLRGDIEAERGNAAAAREAYATALSKLDAMDPSRELLQLKLDNLAVAPASAQPASGGAS